MIQSVKAPTLRCRPLRAMTAVTGTHCPASGRWSPNGEAQKGQVFFEGSLMPSFGGAAVVWVLAPEADTH
ncbi:hypothetical protein ASF72_19780 [Arthrobacter sp. Leaf141]|uniref:hypothetical protein n=1 Tax=unclassified Arthrobacter TaxID=235627 RepID=UPI0006FE6534|nr:hypothetical protein [Arthrobacter sp. Leaf141]KQQ94860.1 hypothetical protein ASF72_19780 [Arthrobacter sp. Leaf141]